MPEINGVCSLDSKLHPDPKDLQSAMTKLPEYKNTWFWVFAIMGLLVGGFAKSGQIHMGSLPIFLMLGTLEALGRFADQESLKEQLKGATGISGEFLGWRKI